MCNQSNSTVATMGIDIGKNSFHVVGLDQRGESAIPRRGSSPRTFLYDDAAG
jgi:hypothetical protein